MTAAPSRRWLAAALVVLALTYLGWFWQDKHFLATVIVFVLPPLLLAAGVLAGRRTPPFWAGVLGLGWFSHAVMVAWSRPAEAGFAWTALLLSLVIVLASSWPGLRARFGRR